MSEGEKKPATTPGGEPEAEAGQPVDRFHPDRDFGSRQDGPGAGLHRDEPSEATPAGSRAAARGGTPQGQGSDDPFSAHRGEPAPMTTGEAQGSGAAAGGGGAEAEDIDHDSAGGGSHTGRG